MANNPKYWNKRQEQLTKQLEKDEAVLTGKLEKVYSRELKKLEKDIASYYTQYGTNGVIEYRNLMQQLSPEDKTMLIERMEDFAEKYPEYRHLMPVRESIYKLNRLEGLQCSMYEQQMRLGVIDKEELEAHLMKQYERGANAMAEELGFGKKFYSFSDDVLKKTVGKAWCNGKNFSDRIWGNRQALSQYLNTEFSNALARGDSYEKCIKALSTKYTNVSKKQMFNLIYTEGTYIMNESAMAPFENNDIYTEYEYNCIEDGKACDVCKGLHGKKFKIGERKPGENFPPMHTRCRCSFLIVIPQDFGGEFENKYKNNLLNNQSSGGIMQADRSLADIATGGHRNEQSLTSQQFSDAVEYAELLGFPKDSIVNGTNFYNTSYFSMADKLFIGTDLYPGSDNSNYANDRVSWRGAIAHEVIGHYETIKKGWGFESGSLYDEVQASIRAARFAPNLSMEERIILLRDAGERAKRAGTTLSVLRDKLHISER